MSFFIAEQLYFKRKQFQRSYNHNVMELTKVIAELRAERAAIDEALAALDRIARASVGKRRGRPPAWLTATAGTIAVAGGERVIVAQVISFTWYRQVRISSHGQAVLNGSLVDDGDIVYMPQTLLTSALNNGG